MKDIDFDELDKAVNSLINPDATSPTPVTTASTLASSPFAERRSTGRFMDVVHPSSDMRSSSSVPPRSSHSEDSTLDSSNSVSADESPEESAHSKDTTWPDPIDMHDTPDATPEAPDPVTTPISEESKDANRPLESPFLADAKVEKRPLGAFSGEVHESIPTAPDLVSEPETETELKDSGTFDDSSKSSDHQILNDTPLPAELQPGLLSIESNEDPNANKGDDMSTVTATPTVPTSITPQYTQQPSTGDKPTGAVFDTQAYKKPQAHAGKKKSGWLIVLWIFLLLVVGAGVGAAVYFFVLPRL